MKGTRISVRIFTALVCVVAALLCAVVPAQAAPDTNDDLLTVGVPADSGRCPVFYRDSETNEIVGIGVDLMRTAAEEAGYEVTFKSIEEKTLKDALDSDAYDVVMPFGSAITSTSGRASIVSENLTQTPFTLVIKAGHELPSLNSLRVGMLSSLSGGAETVRQLYPGVETVLYETMPECVDALRAGKVDALLHNSYVWSYVLQKPSYSDLAVQPSAMFSMDFRAGTLDTPEGRAIIERLNGGIASLSNTRRQAIVLDYTTRKLYSYDFFDYLYAYGPVMLVVILLFAGLIVIAVFRQRALRLEQEERVRQLVDYDSLTGVLSLQGFRKRAEELLRAHPNAPYLLSYNNITGFKYLNDSMGMDAGDDLLRFWAKTTTAALSDEEVMGRIAGDHFAVLRLSGGEERMQGDENVLAAVRDYFINQGKEQRVQLCSGIYVLTPEDYEHIDVDHMLDFARVAAERVRETRKSGYEFYNPEEWEREKRNADIVSYLPVALRDGELRVWYQPQVDYRTKEIIGAEALCRWKHGKLGWVSPAEFIPVLESSELIFDLDCFVWELVCQDLRKWNRQGVHRSVSVNLSRGDIRKNRDIPGHFARLVETYDLTADQIRIEVTETAYVEDPDLLINTTMELRKLGFQVEMDDFGSGYSSLNMLKRVPVDCIKLDLLFLTDSGDSQRGRVIVHHIIQMVNALGMSLIAEGVETAEQAHLLKRWGCFEMQGYHFYKPMPVEEFEALGMTEGPSKNKA